MEKFAVKIASRKRLLSIYLLSVFSYAPLAFLFVFCFGKEALNLAALIFIGIISLSFFCFAEKWSSKSSTFILGYEKVVITYKVFFRKITTHEISYDAIAEYLFQNDQYFSVFKIYPSKGKQLKLYMLGNDRENNERFLAFYSHFEKKIHTENTNRAASHKIKKKATVYESQLGLYLAVFIVMILIALPISYAISGKEINIGNLFIIYPSGILYVYKVFLARKKP